MSIDHDGRVVVVGKNLSSIAIVDNCRTVDTNRARVHSRHIKAVGKYDISADDISVPIDDTYTTRSSSSNGNIAITFRLDRKPTAIHARDSSALDQ